MSSPQLQIDRESEFLPIRPERNEPRWYAVHTRSRHEKRVVAELEEKHVRTFLPLARQARRWSDRWRNVEVPLFSCYAFVHVARTVEERLRVLRTQGVLGFVGVDHQGTPIPEDQIEGLRTVVREHIPCLPYPFLRAGKRVRIRGGSLEGMEGILVGQPGEKSLVISVELLQRSVRVRVEGYHVEPA